MRPYLLFALSNNSLLQHSVPGKGLGGLSSIPLFGCGQAVGLCESLNSLPKGPVYIGVLKQFYNIFTPHVHGLYYSHCDSDCVLTF